MIEITESAQQYLQELLEKQAVEGIGVRVFVADPGTPQAETCIAYCRPGEQQEDDTIVAYNGFTGYIDTRSLPFLEEAHIDFASDPMGGQLTIRAPNAKLPRIAENSPVEDKINYVLYNDINPGLAAHGGQVQLQEYTSDGYAVLKFGGGCQGCSAVDITLKQGVEKVLREKVPELQGVRDSTDHSDTSNAYYR